MKTDDKKTRNNIVVLILVVIILLLLYFLVRRFGYIDNKNALIPTGNVDIFEIDCNCVECQKNIEPPKENDINKDKENNDNIDSTNQNESTDVINQGEITVKIAPGSQNSYTFIIRNNNSFDVVVDIDFIEENEKNINMNYKLRSKGKYLFGNATDYAKFNNFRLEKVTIPAKSQIPYILDWKWVDSDNDTIIGFDYGSNYKLSIKIGVNN